MGKNDRRTRRGKINAGSTGNARPKATKKRAAVKKAAKKATPKKK